jgi:PAS domain S-box-containing protein
MSFLENFLDQKKLSQKKKHFRRPKPVDVEKTFSENEIVVSKTDLRGRITYGNELFVALSGYEQDEILGQPHNMIRHPKMPKVVFKLLWDTVKAGQEINAFVINMAKGGEYYWVLANVTPSFDKNDRIIGFHSTRRRPNRKALEIIKPLYDVLLRNEIVGGMHESEKILNNTLKSKGMNYDEFIFSIQYS